MGSCTCQEHGIEVLEGTSPGEAGVPSSSLLPPSLGPHHISLNCEGAGGWNGDDRRTMTALIKSQLLCRL